MKKKMKACDMPKKKGKMMDLKADGKADAKAPMDKKAAFLANMAKGRKKGKKA